MFVKKKQKLVFTKFDLVSTKDSHTQTKLRYFARSILCFLRMLQETFLSLAVSFSWFSWWLVLSVNLKCMRLVWIIVKFQISHKKLSDELNFCFSVGCVPHIMQLSFECSVQDTVNNEHFKRRKCFKFFMKYFHIGYIIRSGTCSRKYYCSNKPRQCCFDT